MGHNNEVDADKFEWIQLIEFLEKKEQFFN